MTQPQPRREVEELYHAALSRPAGERAAFLAEACGADAELLREVQSLLRCAGDAGQLPVEAISEAETPPQAGWTAATPEMDSASPLGPGQVLGDRYEIRGVLGRGGMGEVWQAHDLKLRVDVALKSLHPRHYADEKRRELLRAEVRSAREVLSPNVCRVFDLLEVDGRELLSMEHLDGETLLSLLERRGPLSLRKAGELAAQFLSGLEAVHRAGLVHRDFKPENVMITRAGRVAVMDFGIARKTEAMSGTIAGTPAYMAPEQLRGETVDARADVYAAGVVLAEMVSGEGAQERTSREQLWRGLRQTPPRVPDGPWAPVIRRAVAAEPEQRPASAEALLRALQEVTLRVEGAEDRRPYPGLASFSEADAEHFFGREAEVEALWRKLQRPRLLALIGPSGAGKSSFLRAGVIPALPEGWGVLYAQPGERPLAALARALVPELAGDAEALRQLLDFEDVDVAVAAVARWRRKHAQALLIVDQFEELFTLCPPEVQTRFAELLGRLAVEADVHVLLAMRDDFLFRCHAQPALTPILSELTLLGPPTGPALQRALVQPALSCGYRFEDEALVNEMLSELSEERGALPLLAFAAASLWERRHRDRGLLTREAYRAIGGVGGALARHAEQTLERIGREREPIVRELFRNLVTAQGTRAVRDCDELLSVFDEREPAERVLQQLVDARLLTSFEVGDADDGGAVRRVEVIHESLLASWPRLVRWQSQDADGARLRDQLRQSARLWDERGRPDELLWTGAPYLEYRAWRERYPGGLSDSEEAFATAMVGLAGRRRRRRRAVVAVAFALLATGLAAISAQWQRAVTQARRAEASKLLALGRLELERDPSAALAYALKSLELRDDPVVREFALGVLWTGPTRIVVEDRMSAAAFSRDGRWLVWSAGGSDTDPLALYAPDGRVVARREKRSVTAAFLFDFSPDSRRLLVSGLPSTTLRLYSIPDLNPLREETFDAITATSFEGPEPVTATLHERVEGGDLVDLRQWPEAGEPRLLGRLLVGGREGVWALHLDRGRDRMAHGRGRDVFVGAFGAPPHRPAQRVGSHESPVTSLRLGPDGRRLASADHAGVVKVFSLARPGTPVRTVQGPISPWLIRFSDDGSRLAVGGGDVTVALVDLTAPPGASALVLRSGEGVMSSFPAFHPSGDWLATGGATSGASLWPLSRRYPAVLEAHRGGAQTVAFSPDGSRLATGGFRDGTVRIWPLDPESGAPSRIDVGGGGNDPVWDVDFSPDGRRLLVGQHSGRVHVVPLDGGPARLLEGRKGQAMTVAFGPRGRRVAAAGGQWIREGRVIDVWDLETGERRTLDAEDGYFIRQIAFLGDGRLLSATDAGGGLRLWDVDAGTSRLLREGTCKFAAAPDERHVYSACWQGSRHWTSEGREAREAEALPLVRTDLVTLAHRPLEQHFESSELTVPIVLDPSGERVITGDGGGPIRVRPVAGGREHLLLGHDVKVWKVAVSPDGRRVASASQDGTVRVWPMPSGQPFHTLPYRELLERLRALTNLRVAADDAATTGYRVEAGRFPGWDRLPTW